MIKESKQEQHHDGGVESNQIRERDYETIIAGTKSSRMESEEGFGYENDETIIDVLDQGITRKTTNLG